MKNRIHRLTLLLAGLGLAAAATLSAQQGAALGTDGEVYIAKTGTYKELFKGGDPALNNRPVLALEIIQPGEPARRILVPTTDGAAVELSPSLLFEESSNTLFLLWQSRLDRIYPVLMLAGFDGQRWIDPVEIGDPLATKNSPQLIITRDSYTVPADIGAAEESRTRSIVHLLWGEEISGTSRTLYTPIILENGAFSGVSQDQIFDLNNLDPSGTALTLPDLPSNVASALRLQPGRDSQTLVAAFTDPDSRRVISAEIDVLPAELSLLADIARVHIIDIGRRSSYPDNLKVIADIARVHIIDIGRRFFHAEIALSLADQIRDGILASQGKEELEKLADITHDRIIALGAKLSGRGLLQATGTTVSRIVEIDGSSSAHHIQFRLASSRPAPEIGNGAVSLFASKSGKEVLVAWVEPERVRYRESNGDDWKKIQEIKLSPSVDLERAYQILEQRMSRR